MCNSTREILLSTLARVSVFVVRDIRQFRRRALSNLCYLSAEICLGSPIAFRGLAGGLRSSLDSNQPSLTAIPSDAIYHIHFFLLHFPFHPLSPCAAAAEWLLLDRKISLAIVIRYNRRADEQKPKRMSLGEHYILSLPFRLASRIPRLKAGY
jgi:hypothetical protein